MKASFGSKAPNPGSRYICRGYETTLIYFFLFIGFSIHCSFNNNVYIYLRILIINMIRISLDLTQGTFSKVEEICKEGFQNKAQYLRMLVDKDIVEREGKR